MPAITQQIPNFLGGVSRQTDDKKLANQLTECVNGYPDPTFGLLKRPGMKHIEVLKKADGTPFNKSELAGAPANSDLLNGVPSAFFSTSICFMPGRFSRPNVGSG